MITNLYALDVGGRTLYLHADNFDHAGRILLDAIDVILDGGAENLRELVAVTPDKLVPQ